MSTGTKPTDNLHAGLGRMTRAFSIMKTEARRRLVGRVARVAGANPSPRSDVDDAMSDDLRSTYELLVSDQDHRYHAVWDSEVFRIANPVEHGLPTAVCGVGRCEPFDESSMAPPTACDGCFLWLREFAPDAECVGAPRRNLAALSDTTLNAADDHVGRRTFPRGWHSRWLIWPGREKGAMR